MKEVQIKIPINEKGEFDLNMQREIAEKYNKIEQIKEKLNKSYEKNNKFKCQDISTRHLTN